MAQEWQNRRNTHYEPYTTITNIIQNIWQASNIEFPISSMTSLGNGRIAPTMAEG